ALRAGGAYVPLDSQWPVERLAWVLADSGVKVAIAEAAFADRLAGTGCDVVTLTSEAAASPFVADRAPRRSAHLAYVIYTSGSTGRPKGALLEHRNVVALIEATATLFAWRDDERWTVFHAPTFDFSVWEIWGALACGGCAVVVPYWVSRQTDAFVEPLV